MYARQVTGIYHAPSLPCPAAAAAEFFAPGGAPHLRFRRSIDAAPSSCLAVRSDALARFGPHPLTRWTVAAAEPEAGAGEGGKDKEEEAPAEDGGADGQVPPPPSATPSASPTPQAGLPPIGSHAAEAVDLQVPGGGGGGGRGDPWYDAPFLPGLPLHRLFISPPHPQLALRHLLGLSTVYEPLAIARRAAQLPPPRESAAAAKALAEHLQVGSGACACRVMMLRGSGLC